MHATRSIAECLKSRSIGACCSAPVLGFFWGPMQSSGVVDTAQRAVRDEAYCRERALLPGAQPKLDCCVVRARGALVAHTAVQRTTPPSREHCPKVLLSIGAWPLIMRLGYVMESAV